jgi:hypothetical protein
MVGSCLINRQSQGLNLCPERVELGASVASDGSKGVRKSTASDCTPDCTSNSTTTNASTLETLAAVLPGLSPEDRSKFGGMLVSR